MRSTLSASLGDRFWPKVVQGEGCWLWRGTKQTGPDGYGRMKVNGRYVSAHRVSWYLSYGEHPKDLNVLHACDTPACVRPSHLFLGTLADNNRDMVMKGRVAAGDRHGTATHPESTTKGERSGHAKLTAEEVIAIRRLYKGGGCTYLALALRFGVKLATVSDIIRRRTWSHVGD